jgi:hypothetical protein
MEQLCQTTITAAIFASGRREFLDAPLQKGHHLASEWWRLVASMTNLGMGQTCMEQIQFTTFCWTVISHYIKIKLRQIKYQNRPEPAVSQTHKNLNTLHFKWLISSKGT